MVDDNGSGPWPTMIMSTLERIENKVDSHKETTQSGFNDIHRQLEELNGQVKKNTDFQYEHKRNHGLIRGREPDPEIAPTYMMAKRHPFRTVSFGVVFVLTVIGMAYEPTREWVLKNLFNIFRAMGLA